MAGFQERFEQLKRELRGRSLPDRTSAFLAFHLEWAEAVKVSDPQTAIRQFALAEECQTTIGTYATGSGEGLASMSELYVIMGKRADVIERLADAAREPAVARRFLNEALKVWTEIQEDPNGLGENTPAASKIRNLKSRIATLKK